MTTKLYKWFIETHITIASHGLQTSYEISTNAFFHFKKLKRTTTKSTYHYFMLTIVACRAKIRSSRSHCLGIIIYSASKLTLYCFVRICSRWSRFFKLISVFVWITRKNIGFLMGNGWQRVRLMRFKSIFWKAKERTRAQV